MIVVNNDSGFGALGGPKPQFSGLFLSLQLTERPWFWRFGRPKSPKGREYTVSAYIKFTTLISLLRACNSLLTTFILIISPWKTINNKLQ